MTNKLVKQSSAATAWTGGAESVTSLSGDFQAQFTLVSGSAGLIVGLAAAGVAPAFAAAEHGILAQAGQYLQVIESGAVVATSDVIFDADTVAVIQRVGTSVGYIIGDWVYSSTTVSSGAKDLLAVLYAPGDAIDSPSFSAYTPDLSTAQVTSKLTTADSYLTDAVVYGLLTNVLTVSSAVDGGIEVTGAYTEYLAVLDSYGTAAEFQALLASALTLRDSASISAQGLLQYATNIASGAVGRYQGFDFSGFCRVGMFTYGFRSDGLYLLRLGDDNGAPISAMVDMAAEALAATMQSRLEMLYFGLDTDGEVLVRMVSDDDREQFYRAQPVQPAVWRAKPALGVNSRHWRMRLEITDATAAQLENVEWLAIPTGRRANR
ncbi:hypothetical protein PMM47T1_13860 [Pseudomonas sp. M47T1]|uniref:hypothetical protein n=1 Tax=Pseudomonas sp. M47T1 TaxID=1179778 RepID=UPI00026085E7|nr:hypothetical protein [Pseudomonas sp. M47T1]EIK96050.1 hypothetical protein PMM47T1_13860 [Pseudomonas sp. M47T1]